MCASLLQILQWLWTLRTERLSIILCSFGLIVVITFVGTQMKLPEKDCELNLSLCDSEGENEISNTDTAPMVCYLSSSSRTISTNVLNCMLSNFLILMI